MKVLLLSITAGQGHNATAKAISNYLDSMQIENKTLDTYRYINAFLGETVNKGYLLTSSKIKHAYAFFYEKLENRKKSKSIMSMTRITNKVLSHKLKKFIISYNPDVIVCTHIFAGILIDVLLEKEKIKAKTVGILTDFTFHPYWEEAQHLDYIIIPNELLINQAKKKGFQDNQIIPLGIPIHPKFSKSISKEEARKSLGLDQNKKTLLIMSGSMGYGNLEETVLELDAIENDFQMITVCGNNKEAKKQIDKLKTKKKILNYGFTTNVDILMDASDCIVTKPGGLTTSEAMAKMLPIIIVHPIPGQEDRNTAFFLNNGVAAAATRTCSIPEIVFQLFQSKKHIELMRECIKLIRKPDATKEICEFIKKIGLDNTDKIRFQELRRP